MTGSRAQSHSLNDQAWPQQTTRIPPKPANHSSAFCITSALSHRHRALFYKYSFLTSFSRVFTASIPLLFAKSSRIDFWCRPNSPILSHTPTQHLSNQSNGHQYLYFVWHSLGMFSVLVRRYAFVAIAVYQGALQHVQFRQAVEHDFL